MLYVCRNHGHSEARKVDHFTLHHQLFVIYCCHSHHWNCNWWDNWPNNWLHFLFEIDFYLAVRKHVFELIIRSELKVIIVLQCDLAVCLQLLFGDEFLLEDISEFSHLLRLEDKLELVLERLIGGVVEFDEVRFLLLGILHKNIGWIYILRVIKHSLVRF